MAVLKVVEIMSSSDKSWEDATENGVKKASKTIKNIRSAWVKDQTAEVKDGKITQYRVNLKVTFEID